MSKTIDELRASLERAGWRFGPALKDTGVSWYAWQRLDGVADCTCNDKPPSLILSPFELAINGEIHGSVEFEVCGEVPSGRWVNLKAYSVPLAEAMQSIPECARILSAAWNAAAAPLPDEQPSNPVARKFFDLALGARFKYAEGDREFVVLERHGCGKVAEYAPLGEAFAGQGIYSAFDSEEECRTAEVFIEARIVGQQTKGGGK